MLAYDAERQTYSLGVRLVRLAHAAWAQSSIAPLARPFIDRLSAEVGETIHLAQLDQGQVLYSTSATRSARSRCSARQARWARPIARAWARRCWPTCSEDELAAALDRQSFHRFTEHTLDTPDKLMAELKAIRARGFAYDREEHEPASSVSPCRS